MISKVHRIRFYNPKPQSINCVSFNKLNKYIAVARCDASIEIWDLNYAPFMIKFISGVENGSVEALAWVGDRLLSTGLGGALVEWDVDKLCVKTNILLTGYAAWCLDVNLSKALAAIGTEQGYVNLFSVKKNEIVYNKLFDKQEGRILCCKFDTTGNVLVTGSIDSIRVWNVETGHATCRMSVSRRGKETIVWCVGILSDNIIVSGDSHGRLTFWDSSFGDQIESYTTHKADILSLAVSEDETSIYCSGVDPVIVNFIKVNTSTGKQSAAQWVKHVQRNIHEHDVRALVINDEQLISVGADGYLTFSSYPPKWVMRIPPLIPVPRSSICPKKKMLLLRYSNHLEVWKLGSYATDDTGKLVLTDKSPNSNVTQKASDLEQDSITTAFSNSTMSNTKHNHLKLTTKPLKLITIKTKNNKQIRCCEISPSGEFVIYSTDSDIRMLKLDIDADGDQTNTSISKVKVNGVTCCDRVAFSEDSRTVLVHSASTLRVMHVDPDAGASVIQTIDTDKYLKTPTLVHLLISNRSPNNITYIVAADTKGGIAVWTQRGEDYKHYVTLPTYRCVTSSVTVDSKREMLIATYVDQKVIEYDLRQKKLLDSTIPLPEVWVTRRSAIRRVEVHPRRNALTFADDTSMWVVERKLQTNTSEPVAKRKSFNNDVSKVPFKIIQFKYLAGFHWLDDNEAVMLEILPENIVSQLPPVIASNKKKFD